MEILRIDSALLLSPLANSVENSDLALVSHLVANRYSAQLRFATSRYIAACALPALDAYVTFKMFFHPVGPPLGQKPRGFRTSPPRGSSRVFRGRIPTAYGS